MQKRENRTYCHEKDLEIKKILRIFRVVVGGNDKR